MGRRKVMTPDVIEKICVRLAGGESLRSICRDEGMPHISTVMLAVVDDREGFRASYMHAREAGGFAHADRIIEVVEQLGGRTLDHQTAKAMMDGLKWAAERMAPKAHSPRQELDHTTGGEKMQPTRIEIVAPAERNDIG